MSAPKSQSDAEKSSSLPEIPFPEGGPEAQQLAQGLGPVAAAHFFFRGHFGGGEAQLIGPGQGGDVHRPGQGRAGNSQLPGPPGHADDGLAAQALAVQPALAGYDQVRVRRQTGEIRRIQQDLRITCLYVTHDQTEAMTLGDRIVIMRDGYIQQIGTPQEVFNHPANLFVAGFIGSPQMNFFENCQLTKTAGGYTLTVMGETVTLTAEQSAKLAAAGVESRSVTAGVRPVHIALGESGIPAEVDVSELMGSELHLHLAANGQDVVAVIPTANIDPMAYARHTAVKFGFDAKLVHLFDSDSEKNLI